MLFLVGLRGLQSLSKQVETPCTRSLTDKGGLKSKEIGEFLLLQKNYSKSLSWAENLNKLFTILGGKFKFSAQDSDLKYVFWRSKNPSVSSDLKPPLAILFFRYYEPFILVFKLSTYVY